jgi:hypothetical protein
MATAPLKSLFCLLQRMSSQLNMVAVFTVLQIACILSPTDCSDCESWISAERVLELKEGGC